MGEDMRRAEGARAGRPGAGRGRRPTRRTSATRSAGRSARAASIGSNEQMLPDGDAAARARALLDEIRRRAGEQPRPQLELDYLRRLLDLF